MITGASLSLSQESVDKECRGLTYQVAVPTMKSIFTSSTSNNICGETTISICMRMSLKSVKKGNKSFIYKKLPEIKIKLPCSDESFIGAGFEVKTISDDSSTIGLEIEAKRVVSFMKLFNATSCDKEQEWQAINNVVAALPVTWSAEGTSPVSIKLMDSYGYESKCISQVAHQSKLEEKTPTETETLTESDTLTETSTNTASSCLENETNLIAANIKKGVSISGVTGTGELSLALCTSDGQTNCIATDDFNAEEASSILAANIKSGSTIGGVAGSAIVESRSDCSADGSESCIANASYKATLVAGLAAKVVSGQTVAGVSGTAISQKFDCSSDGQVNCAASSTYKAVLSTGLAAKVVLGETVGGVAGTTQEEAVHTNCTGANQTGCLATSSYKTMDLSSADDGGALDLTSSNFNARMASSSVFEYWDDLGVRHTNTGAADLTAANIETGTEILGVNGSANPPLDCSSISAGTWLLVPGDPDFGTNDFCIMNSRKLYGFYASQSNWN